MDEKMIKEFYESCNVCSIEDITSFKLKNGEKNPNYFYDVIAEREKTFENNIKENKYFDLDTKERLNGENRLISFLHRDIVRFYDALCKHYDALNNKEFDKAGGFVTSMQLNNTKIKQTFNTLKYQKLFIRNLVSNEKFKEAKRVRDFCLDLFESLLFHFEQYLGIDLLNSPFKELFNTHLKMLNASINTDEISLMTIVSDIEIQKDEIPNEIDVWYSEYELRQFIDMAIRWGIEGVYNSRTKENPYSVFKDYVNNSRHNFELFRTQLNNKLSKSPNWRAIGIDLNQKFLLGINHYIDWYNINVEKLQKFEPYNPYAIMLSVIESTKNEILQYFPEFNYREKSKPVNIVNRNKPNFASSIVDEVYSIFKEHFDEQEHNALENLLKNGIEPKNKLYFKNNGNKLTDALKKLYEAYLITQCNKVELQKWVCDNFQFKNRRTNDKEDFKLKTVQDVISNKNSKQPCINSLFSIFNGSIIKV